MAPVEQLGFGVEDLPDLLDARRMISNVRVRPTASEAELDVRSYILLYRSRGTEAGADLISAERRDVWRRVDATWRLARRFVLFDQSTLGVASLTNFL